MFSTGLDVTVDACKKEVYSSKYKFSCVLMKGGLPERSSVARTL